MISVSRIRPQTRQRHADRLPLVELSLLVGHAGFVRRECHLTPSAPSPVSRAVVRSPRAITATPVMGRRAVGVTTGQPHRESAFGEAVIPPVQIHHRHVIEHRHPVLLALSGRVRPTRDERLSRRNAVGALCAVPDPSCCR